MILLAVCDSNYVLFLVDTGVPNELCHGNTAKFSFVFFTNSKNLKLLFFIE